MHRANESLIRERQQIPKLEEILPELSNTKYFSRIDLREGYDQVEQDSNSHVTAFITHEGTFHSKYLVYGAKPAFEHFRKIIEQTIAGCPGTKSISDDVLIWSSSINKMKERLDKLFDTIAKNGLKINLKKCIFGVQELTFAGLKLTNKGIIPDSSKVDGVTNAKVPTNVTKVKSFLGLVNYCSQFIPGYVELTEPLRKLTKKNTKFKWSSKHQHSFENLKLALVNSETMAYYIPDAETKVVVDASPIGLGAILSQKKKTGEFRPVVYASKALNPTERRYSQTGRESLAVLLALQKFHYYIYGREFTLITDHQPLTKLLSSRGNPTPRIQRWLL